VQKAANLGPRPGGSKRALEFARVLAIVPDEPAHALELNVIYILSFIGNLVIVGVQSSCEKRDWNSETCIAPLVAPTNRPSGSDSMSVNGCGDILFTSSTSFSSAVDRRVAPITCR